MIFGLGALLFVFLLYGPHLWIKYVMWKHSDEISDMPGTGGELAKHLVEKYELPDVEVVLGEEGQDHYSPDKKQVSLSPSVYNGKTLTAIAVAAHEVGHAIQFSRNEPVSQLREKYLGKAVRIRKIAASILFLLPIITIVFKVPQVFLLVAGAGVITMLASASMYVAILPEEYDASFKKALPILKEGYVPEKYMPAIEQVLRAAAFTYVAAALADIIRLWRWIRVFR